MREYDVDPQKLAEVFQNTTATYKFYWMLALIDCIRAGKIYQDITFTEMVARMIAKAWAPLTSGMFSFGKGDAMWARVTNLIFATELKNCDTEERVLSYITHHSSDPVVKMIVDKMTNYVPYRFLYPWLGFNERNKPIEIASQDFVKNRCPYSINKKTIKINPAWAQYLMDHADILEGFTKYYLTIFLMKFNDNIVLPEEESLSMTADGSYTSMNSQMGFASEPLPQYETNREIADLKKQVSDLNKIIKILGNNNNFINYGTFVANANNVQQNTYTSNHD